MTDADKTHAQAVEAVARAICDDRYLLVAAVPFEHMTSRRKREITKASQRLFDAGLAAMDRAGWAVVPVEATLEMAQDGHEAARKVRVSGISGMTIEAQTRAECAREIAAYRAMVAARPKVAK